MRSNQKIRAVTEEEIAARSNAEYREIEQRELSKKEAGAMLRQLLHRLDEYALECALNLGPYESAIEGEVYEFVGKLNPALPYLFEKIGRALPADYPNNAIGRPCDDLLYIQTELPQVAFIIGVITGAKFGGASPKLLEHVCGEAAGMIARGGEV